MGERRKGLCCGGDDWGLMAHPISPDGLHDILRELIHRIAIGVTAMHIVKPGQQAPLSGKSGAQQSHSVTLVGVP